MQPFFYISHGNARNVIKTEVGIKVSEKQVHGSIKSRAWRQQSCAKSVSNPHIQLNLNVNDVFSYMNDTSRQIVTEGSLDSLLFALL